MSEQFIKKNSKRTKIFKLNKNLLDFQILFVYEEFDVDKGWEKTPSFKNYVFFESLCRCSSVVEHVIGNDGVESPILFSGTNKTKKTGFIPAFLF